MKLEIPGQLCGPECRPVMHAAIWARKRLESVFVDVQVDGCDSLTVLLRVGGSLRDFGGDRVLPPVREDGRLVCEVEIADAGWASLSDAVIRGIVTERVLLAISRCVDMELLSPDVLEQATPLLKRG